MLGEVEVWLAGRRLDIGHSRQRCVLVALLLDLNRPLPVDQLIDRVWAADPPHRARNALAGYISRLRAQFSEIPDASITHGPGGYLLSVAPHLVDLCEFRELASQARAADEPAAAAALFGRALDLWRGDPFTTIDTPWFNDVRSSLLAEKFSVVVDGFDAGLQSGSHRELIVPLVAERQMYPLDERLAAQLMTALNRSGRQADALSVYRQMRERLVSEIGVEPGLLLRETYRQVLDGDPVPIVMRTRPEAGLPRRATSFIGRSADVAGVAAALRTSPLVTLAGVGGVGKTRLALEAAAGAQQYVPDGVWLCELAPVDADAVGHALAAALKLQQRRGLDIGATVIEYLHARELLLVIDNCEHVLDAAALLIDQIVRHCPKVTVLATSREPLAVEGERIVAVAPLSADLAAELFADRARAGRPDFDIEREPVGAVAEICRRLDGLPLAIELAAARMRVMSTLDMARRLDGLRLLSGGPRGTHPRQQSLEATIDWSYRLLDSAEQDLFMRLSVFAGGFDLESAHRVCGRDVGTEDDALELLTALVDRSMVTVRGAGTTRFSVLETLRLYGRERLRDSGFSDDTADRHVHYFAGLAESAAAGMHTAAEGDWVRRMLPDYDNLRAAFERATATGDVESMLRLVTSMPELVHLRIGYEPADWAERTLERTPPDHPLYPAVVGFAARGAWNRGDQQRARILAARAGGRRPGRGTGRVAYPGDVLADVALYEDDPGTALTHYDGEVRRARADDDPVRLVWNLFYVAICHAALRRPADGLTAAEEAVRVAAATENPTARSMAAYALGLVLKKADPERALTLFDTAASEAAAVQNFWWHGIALMEAAATRGVHGEPAAAAAGFITVLDHWDRVGDWSQQWLNLRYVTRFLQRVGAVDDAQTLHHALVRAGRASPLDLRTDAGAGAIGGVEAVALARAVLRKGR